MPAALIALLVMSRNLDCPEFCKQQAARLAFLQTNLMAKITVKLSTLASTQQSAEQ
jgi:hypothetical protein